MSPIRAFIPASGTGYKVRVLGGRFTDGHAPYAVPKLRLTTAGVPVVYATLRSMQNAGVRHVDITHAISPSVESLRAFVEAHPRFKGSMNVKFIREPQPVGTGVSLINALRSHGSDITPETTILIYYGDILCNINLRQFIQAHKSSEALATVAVNPVPLGHAHKYGLVNLKGGPSRRSGEDDDAFAERFHTFAYGLGGEMRRIDSFSVKDDDERKWARPVTSLLTDSSILAFQASVLFSWAKSMGGRDLSKEERKIEGGLFSHLFDTPKYAKRFYAYVLPPTVFWRDLGTYSDIWLASMDALDRTFPIPLSIPHSRPHVWIHPEAKVASTATLIPPVIVEERAVVHDQATVGPYVHVGPDWVIQPYAHVAGTDLSAATFYFQGDTVRTVGAHARIVLSIIAGGYVPDGSDLSNVVGYVYRHREKDDRSTDRFDTEPMGADQDLAAARLLAGPSLGDPRFFSVEKPKDTLK